MTLPARKRLSWPGTPTARKPSSAS